MYREPHNLVLSVIESLCIMWHFEMKLVFMEDHVVLLVLGKKSRLVITEPLSPPPPHTHLLNSF